MDTAKQRPLPTSPSGTDQLSAAGDVDRAETVDLLRARIAGLVRSDSAHRTPAQPRPDREPSKDLGQDDAAAARAVCLRLLTVSARPRAHLERALAKRGFEPEVIAPVLDRLTEVGLIDDRAYAEAFVRGRHQGRALARPALDRELRQRGVDPDIVAGAVAQLDDGAEAARAEEFVRKRINRALTAGPEAARRRLLGQLARRGYSGDVAFRVVEAALIGMVTPVPLAD